ncbi:Enoyl-[acyl-carrier-protein] reductase [NADH] FabI [Buchnera aphidicola (Eriosoma grossulariae)]|uniref:enoyl-ACP reductase FabI n=1 Tax=Buchnera aphidicola TaxID=9 RepID=UPI0034646813
MKFLSGKKILITGLLNNYSIAFGIAQSMFQHGAELAFTYSDIRLKKKVKLLAKSFNSKICLFCDVNYDLNIVKLFLKLSQYWKKFDGFVHCLAFASRSQFKGDYLQVISKEDFEITHNITSYSFVAMARESLKMLNKNSALITLSYLGAVRVIPYYNIMGVAKASLESNVRYVACSLGKYDIRVNAISSGPIRTVSSSVIKNFHQLLKKYKKNSPIKRDISIHDIGNTASFLCSNLSIGITGQIIYVDNGFNITAI